MLDNLPAKLGFKHPFRNLLSIAKQGQGVAFLIECQREACKPLVTHELQEMCLRKPLGILCVETVASVLDGIDAVQRHAFAGR